MELLGHRVCICSALGDNTKKVSPSSETVYEIFSCSTYLSTLGNFNHYIGCVLVSHCGYLYFHEIEKAEHLKIFFTCLWLFKYFLLWVLVQTFCSFFYWVIFFKVIVRNFYTLGGSHLPEICTLIFSSMPWFAFHSFMLSLDEQKSLILIYAITIFFIVMAFCVIKKSFAYSKS